MSDSRLRPPASSSGTEQVTVDLVEHVATDDAAVGDTASDIERQVAVLEQQHLAAELREGVPEAARVAGRVARERGEVESAGGERSQGGFEVSPLGQREADHPFSSAGSSARRLGQRVEAKRETDRRDFGAELAKEGVVAPAARNRERPAGQVGAQHQAVVVGAEVARRRIAGPGGEGEVREVGELGQVDRHPHRGLDERELLAQGLQPGEGARAALTQQRGGARRAEIDDLGDRLAGGGDRGSAAGEARRTTLAAGDRPRELGGAFASDRGDQQLVEHSRQPEHQVGAPTAGDRQ